MSFFNKAKQAAEQAAAKAREGVEDVQQKRELGQAYGDLGRTAFELIESGEVSHPKLETAASRIRELTERMADSSGGESLGTSSEPVDVDPSQPPAMPT